MLESGLKNNGRMKKKWHHSPNCHYKGHEQEEPICSCRHPECLHGAYFRGTKVPPTKCTSKDCEGQCESYWPE